MNVNVEVSMAEPIYDKKEFLKKVALAEETVDALLKAQVLRPAGRVDDEMPYFDEGSAEAGEAIAKLFEIGYDLDEVIRIRRKIGLPKKRAARTGKGRHLLTVGALAKRIDSNARTIKHWEEKGIIEPDSYSPGGFRIYGEHYVKLCLLIQDLQLFGYSLDEIKIFADLFRDFLAIRDRPDDLDPALILKKAGRMKEQVAGLNSKMRLFEKGIDRWRGLLKQKQRELSIMTAKIEKKHRKGGKDAGTAKAAVKGDGQKKSKKTNSKG